MVLGHLVRWILAKHRAHSLDDALFALDQRIGDQRAALTGIKLDMTADRLRSQSCELQLASQPVRGDHAVGVGTGDQATISAKAEQALAGKVHAQPACTCPTPSELGSSQRV